jgi:outer membrane protein TolC
MRGNCPIRKILIIILICFCFHICGSPFSVIPSQAGEPEALTLSLAIDTALKNNPLIRITLSGSEIADAQLREVRAGRFPLLQFSKTFTRSDNNVLPSSDWQWGEM